MFKQWRSQPQFKKLASLWYFAGIFGVATGFLMGIPSNTIIGVVLMALATLIPAAVEEIKRTTKETV